MSWTERAGMSFRIALRPPMRLAEPGSAWIVVTPPAMASGICGSCGQNECSAHTSAVTGFVASLPSDSASVPGAAYTPRCEWSSTSPGVTYLPVPSTTTAPAGASTFAPTATIRPSLSTIEPLGISWPVAVMIVALRIKTGGLGCRAYVDGYCGRSTLELSDFAAEGTAAGAAGAAGAGARAGPVPLLAHAHPPARASSRDNGGRLPQSPPGVGYFTSSMTTR